MTYPEAIEFLYSLQLFGAKPGLERAQRLAELAGHPERQLQFIHVAGTNGKGSTCAMLEAIYRAAGWRVGLYTSPHLVSFRERIQVNRQLIPEPDLVRLVQEARDWLGEFTGENHPTFFEVVTVIALRYFAEQKCELVIWETGLGGRLDATNIVTPLASVITNVQFDHEKWLGHTLEAIAREKAGIIKPGVPVITAAEEPALTVIAETARHSDASLRVVSSADALSSEINLPGAHQRLNAAVTLATVDVLAERLPVPMETRAAALRQVHWPARFQVVRRGAQTIVLDGAHNPAGARALVETLRREFAHEPVTFVIGVLADKDWRAVIHTFGEIAHTMVFVPVASNRTAAAEELATVAWDTAPRAIVRCADSLHDALASLATHKLVVIAGSLYLVGEAIESLGLEAATGERALNEWAATR